MHPRDGYPSKCYRTSTVPAVGESVAAEVRMSVEDYLEIMRIIGEQGPEVVRRTRRVASEGKKFAKAVKKRAGKKDPKMAKALRKANALMRTKTGKLRKGKTQADVMRKAHQLRRKM